MLLVNHAGCHHPASLPSVQCQCPGLENWNFKFGGKRTPSLRLLLLVASKHQYPVAVTAARSLRTVMSESHQRHHARSFGLCQATRHEAM